MDKQASFGGSVKSKILNAAWALFLQQGYEETTINQILKESHASRGAFYHHFRGKEDLLFQLAYAFDDIYEHWISSLDHSASAISNLIALDHYIMGNLEDSPFRGILAPLYGLQVMTEGTRHINNPERAYYQIVNQLMKEGVESGEIKSSLSYKELAETFIIIERGTTYDWLLSKQRYSLPQYCQRIMLPFLTSLKK